jgi:glycosyltransferase involved in cell wall biosynthesis
MRILTISYEYPPLGGGGGVALAHSAKIWATRGHKVTIVTSGGIGLPACQRDGTMEIYRVPVLARNARATASLLSMLSFPFLAEQFVRRRWKSQDFDVILSCFAVPSGVVGMGLAQAWQRPHVVWVLGGDAYDPSKLVSPHRVPFLKQTVAAVLGRAQAIITMSEDMACRVKRIYHSHLPLTVIPPGLELPPPRPSNCSNGTVTIVSIARLVRRKRLDHLIRTFATLPRGFAQLLIVGDGPLHVTLQSLINQLDVAEYAKLVGYLSEEEKYSLLRRADLFALVSAHEGFGLVYLEAASQSLPIVAGNIGGQVDFLVHGKTGWLVPYDNHRQLANALFSLVTQPKLRLLMGRQALQMSRRYHITQVADDFLQVLGRVL